MPDDFDSYVDLMVPPSFRAALRESEEAGGRGAEIKGTGLPRAGKDMSLKKSELYRGFNIFTEEARPGVWRVALVEIPSEDGGAQPHPAGRPGGG